MHLLEEKIRRDGQVLPGNILKVGSFLNHQLDVDLLDKMGEEIYCLYGKERITKILTIEASGIAIACMAARHFGVPVVFAKKSQSQNISGDVFSVKVESFTHKRVYDVIVAREFLSAGDRVLIVDDFLANGKALVGLIELVRQAGAQIVGAAIAIEKGFQGGGDLVRGQGVRVESLAIIEQMDSGEIRFR